MKTLVLLWISCCSFWSPNTSINPEREQLLDKVFQLLEENIANPYWLETDSFIEFKEDLYSDKVMKMSEDDFIQYFKEVRHNLDFSHIDIRSKKYNNKYRTGNNDPAIEWKALNSKTVYLRVRTFVTDASPMVKALSEIGTEQYENLIIDLRDNGGGSLDAPVVLGRFLTQESIDAGVYLNRSWFEKNKRTATAEDIKSFPYLTDFTFKGISKMYSSTDAFRMVLPPHNQPVYQGNVYVLINSNTASACEPLIDLVQNKGIGTIIGPPSAGNMLSGASFKIDDNYELFLPIADYQTGDGRRLDKVGVIPKHRVRSEEALNYVLTELIK